MLSVDETVKRYLELRSKKERMEQLVKEKLISVIEEMEQIELTLKNFLDEAKLESVKTCYGTPYKTTATSVTVQDMDEVLDFIRTQNAWHLIEKKVNE